MAFDTPGIEERFPTSASGPKPAQITIDDSNVIRHHIVTAADHIEQTIPAGRWKSLALTALEESLMWANKALFNQK